MSEYTVVTKGVDIADGYEKWVRPDGTALAFITEPEDRTYYRDYKPVLYELNRLQRDCQAKGDECRHYAELAGRLQREVDRLAALVEGDKYE